MVKRAFRVPDMHCSSCVMRLEGIEDELAGIRSVKASYVRHYMEVEYDERQVTEEQIILEAKRRGYVAIPVVAQ
jgi:copper chaperone CopZ